MLRNKIVDRFPQEINRYIEVFGGAGWVLFSRDKHADMEVYNDANGQLVNLFRCVKYHPEELCREIQGLCLTSRELFLDCKDQLKCRGMTDIQRAARFFVVIKTSYGSDCDSFRCTEANILNAVRKIADIQKRLSKVVVENKDFENLIHQYDRIGALFYCDPPYYATKYKYEIEFGESDHVRLRDTLCGINGKFILSYNDNDFVRNLYKDFKIEEVQRQNNLKTKSGGYIFKELIITNY